MQQLSFFFNFMMPPRGLYTIIMTWWTVVSNLESWFFENFPEIVGNFPEMVQFSRMLVFDLQQRNILPEISLNMRLYFMKPFP